MSKTFEETLFNASELERITFDNNFLVQNIVYCSFENRFAKSGGLAAVATTLLPHLQEEDKTTKVFLITPFHSKISGFKNPPKNCLWDENISFNVPFGKNEVKVDIYKYIWEYDKQVNKKRVTGDISEFYLRADGFFEAENKLNDPYIYDAGNIDKNSELLFKDAAFFCKVVPYAMKALGYKKNIVFHLQDWQTSLISLTSKEALAKGRLESCKCVLTMHNTFDSYVTNDDYFKNILVNMVETNRSDKIRSAIGPDRHSAFSFALDLIDTPITTVSKSFAKEFTTDKIQTMYFAKHLQSKFKKSKVIGINNGRFVDFPDEIKSKLNSGLSKDSQIRDHIKEIKLNFRTALLNVLHEYKPSERFGELTYKNESIKKLAENVPIFLMSGRLDPNQKGYDILLRAIEKIGREEIAKFILTPMPIRDADLNYFYKIACKCKGNITVFPIRMEKGYKELQVGSSFGIMPSIYEPFGAAIEYMVNGTVTIARKTGGLLDQIIDNKSGLLYSEEASTKTSEEIETYFNSSGNVENRFISKNDGWAESMAIKLNEKIKYAINIYNKDTYYDLIVEGLNKAKEFDWAKSAKDYFTVFNK